MPICGLEYLPKTGDKSQVQVELILQPLNSGSGLICEDLDEIWPGLISRGLKGIVVEELDGIWDLLVDLCPGKGTVDAGSGLRDD